MENLIVKYLSSQASEDELLELKKWVELSDENREKFINSVNVYTLSSVYPIKEESEEVIQSAKYGRGKATLIIAILTTAAIAAGLLLGAYFYTNYKIDTYKQDVSYILAQSDSYIDYYTPLGVKGKITLPDSSIVWLNSGSRISFPSKFTGKDRTIHFVGEGYFNVVSDSLRPMVINTINGVEIKVLGTEFNLSAYNEDKLLSVMLINGTVELHRGLSKTKLIPLDKVDIDFNTKKETIEISIEKRDVVNITGWKDGWLVFEDIPLSEVFAKMRRWYGIKIDVVDEEICKQSFTAKFREESASQVFELMQKTLLLRYEMTDSIAVIRKY